MLRGHSPNGAAAGSRPINLPVFQPCSLISSYFLIETTDSFWAFYLSLRPFKEVKIEKKEPFLLSFIRNLDGRP